MTHTTCSPLSTASCPRILRNQSKHNFIVPYCQTAVYLTLFILHPSANGTHYQKTLSHLSQSLLKHYLNSEYKVCYVFPSKKVTK